MNKQSKENHKKNYKLTKNEIMELVKEKKMNYSEDTVNKIFKNLDIDGKGFIMRDDLIDYLENHNSKNFEELSHNLSKTFLLSKSELILIKLKRIRRKLFKDEESLEDIDWIIKAINDQTDLYEPDLGVNRETDDIKAIKQYSKFEMNQSTRNDLQKVVKSESTNGIVKKEARRKSVLSNNKKARYL